jgi:hypothetical protein
MAVQERRHARFLGAAAAAMAAAGCAGSGAFVTNDIPDALRAPANQLLTQQAHAKGVQIYQCKSSKEDATRFEWVLLAPEASLFDSTGKKIAKHYAGPTWEGLDGSQVVGQVAARANSPDGHSIPWLLLTAKSTSGRGQFGAVASIQRLHTVGGNAPPACSPAKAGSELRVAYSADYYFYIGPRS